MANEKIYIADDDENIHEAIKTFLKSEGYEVTAFENGDLLLAGFHNAPSDLVILDVMMPGSNGFAICTEIRKTSTVVNLIKHVGISYSEFYCQEF